MRGQSDRWFFNPIAFFMGFALGLILLIIWGSLPGTVYQLSALSPHGPQVYVSGFRIKHWMVGVVLTIVGLLLSRTHNWSGWSLTGFGVILVLDELLTWDLF